MGRPTTGRRTDTRSPLGRNGEPNRGYNDVREALLSLRLPDPQLPLRHTQRTYVALRHGQPVIYEYSNEGKLLSRASYLPNRAPRRNFYRTGDVILTGKRSLKWVCNLFPEFRPKKGGDSLLVTLAKKWKTPPERHTIGFRIEKIEPIGNRGQGMITVRGVVFFDNNVVFTEHTSEKPSKWVHDDFYYHEIGQASKTAANIVETFMTIATDVGVVAGLTDLLAVAKKAAKRDIKVWLIRQGQLRKADQAVTE
ncbi:MAG: hypothetical protein GY953_01155 [bacterium]|nr:hypothetical protein [bacterium]